MVVEQPVTTLEQQLHALFPGEDITVEHERGRDDSVRPRVEHQGDAAIGEIAAASTAEGAGHQPASGARRQREPAGDAAGAFRRSESPEAHRGRPGAVRARSDFAGRSTTQQFAAPDFDDEKPGGLVFSDFLNLFFFDRKHGIGGVLKALQSTGGFQSLAEPNLIAYNGQEASFLAGGEFPIPVVQGTSDAVTVVFKEFGIRLELHSRPSPAT